MKMTNSIVRIDKWYLSPSAEVKKYLEMTIREYHQFGRALSYIVMGHWRPTGGRKRSSLRQRFHGWLHRRLVLLTEEKFEEIGGKTELVYARGTSSWAYDGSGKVKRSQSNYSLATLANGKHYNADLSASYNIAAQYIAYKLKLTRRNDGRLSDGQSSERLAKNACYSVSPLGWRCLS